jgi:hypothetical protein
MRMTHPGLPTRTAHALAAIAHANAADPHLIAVDGQRQPYELLYAQWLLGWVLRLQPDASEALRLAAAGQHIERWLLPRDRYPMTRAGYLKWREVLKQRHAQRLGEILAAAGYPPQDIEPVQALVLKKRPLTDPQMQTLEDALCLVFLERQLNELQAKTPDEKMIEVLRKAWGKMSPRAQALALELRLSEGGRALLTRALKSASG